MKLLNRHLYLHSLKLIVLLPFFALNPIVHAKTVEIEVIDAFINAPCSLCKIEVKIDHDSSKMVSLDEKGKIIINYKNTLTFDASKGQENYLESIYSFDNEDDDDTILENFIYPNETFERLYLKEKCSNYSLDDILDNDSIKSSGENLEQQAELQGGGLDNFLADHFNYPHQAFLGRESGKAVVAFIVEKDGQVKCPQTIQSAGSNTDAELIRVVRQMPHFEPAKLKGKPVIVKVLLRANFLVEPY